MKIRFTHYIHDEFEDMEEYEAILSQIPQIDASVEEFAELLGQPFYEIRVDCEFDTVTREVTILNAQSTT